MYRVSPQGLNPCVQLGPLLRLCTTPLTALKMNKLGLSGRINTSCSQNIASFGASNPPDP
eukprot:1160811-Pelagomonas_calceolata.AAC.12